MSSSVSHTLLPIFDDNSKILILGTMPSPKSREIGFYYSHPQNRFWSVLSAIFEADIPSSNNGRKDFLLSHRIALWDVLKSCDIKGADDSSIINPIPNDLSEIIKKSNISQIFTTGKKATDLFIKYNSKLIGTQPIYLPSTSPANCRVKFDELVDSYKIIFDYL